MLESSEHHDLLRREFRDFVDAKVRPLSATIHAEQHVPKQVIEALGKKGYLIPWLSKSYGGQEMDQIAYGLLTEEINHACSSTRTILTVQGMVAQAIDRRGTREQREAWLSRMVTGEIISGFAMTEPEKGNDASHPTTTAELRGSSYVINGTKRWISFGQIADLFLVFTTAEGGTTALLVEADRPGVTVTPLKGMIGKRGAMLAEIVFEDCEVPSSNRIGPEGAGFSLVGSMALELGRYSVAWGCVGLIRGCLDACTDHARTRNTFGVPIGEHQLVKRMLTDMLVGLHTSDLMCRHAGALRQKRDPRSTMETMMAKYHASVTAAQIATNAVQLHGAVGCQEDHQVARFYGDIKVMEIIEGSSEIQQVALAGFAFRDHPTL